MYVPDDYRQDDTDELLRLIEAHPLGAVITHREELDANHLPLWVDRHPSGLRLIGHVSRNNALWRSPAAEPVLVLFQGAQGYISPNWYPGKQENENQVPTWNYQVVHVHGVLTVVDDPRFVRGVVARLTTQNEASQPRPWKMTDSEASYIDGELTKIVGIQIEVKRLEGKFKLSQNRNAADRLGAIEGVDRAGNPELSQAMAREKDKQLR